MMGKDIQHLSIFGCPAISYASNWEIESLGSVMPKGGVVFRMQSAGTSSNKPGSVSETAGAHLSDKMRRDLQKN